MKKIQMKGFRKGFTMTELVFVLVLGGILIVGGLLGFNKVYTPTVANSEYSKAMQLISAVERAASDNTGRYPLQATAAAVSSVTKVVNQMGGSANVGDLNGWTYQCTGSVATITTAAMATESIAGLLQGKINGSSPNWVAANPTATHTVSITKSNVTCN